MKNKSDLKIEEWSKGLTNGYMTKLLKQQGAPVTPGTIKMKRDIVMLKRASKDLKKTIDEKRIANNDRS